MMTYLDLVNSLITELGINGGQLITATGGATLAPGSNTPGQGASTYSLEVARICQFVADADYEIQSLHHNWRFLWRQYRDTMTVGGDVLNTPKYSAYPFTIRALDRASLVMNYTSLTQAFRPAYQEWREFETMWQSRGAKNVSDYATNWSQTPAGNPILSHVTASAVPYQYEGWIRPQRLRSDGDISPIVLAVANNNPNPGLAAHNPLQDAIPPQTIANPSGILTPSSNFSANSAYTKATADARYESARIIIVRTKIIWAEVEGATEIMQGALAEYQDLLEELRADQLPSMRTDRMSEDDLQMVVEGF